MRSLFKKQIEEAELKESKPNIFFEIYQKYYLIVQDRWAKKMALITSDLSRRNLIYLLSAFVIITIGLNIYIISSGFSSTVSVPINVIPLSKSVVTKKESTITIPRQLTVSKKEFRRILAFRGYLDSLEKTPLGKRCYDSISLCRPGLFDSLVFIENYYKSNIKE